MDVVAATRSRDTRARRNMQPPRTRDRNTYNCHMDKDFEVVILGACRTPIGAFGGALKDLSAADLGAVVIREAVQRAGVQTSDLDDVILGCVLQAGAGMNVARQAALKAGVPQDVPAETVNRVCGSGL